MDKNQVKKSKDGYETGLKMSMDGTEPCFKE